MYYARFKDRKYDNKKEGFCEEILGSEGFLHRTCRKTNLCESTIVIFLDKIIWI